MRTKIFLLTLVAALYAGNAFSQIDTAANQGGLFNGIKRGGYLIDDTIIKKGIKFKVTKFAVQLNAGESIFFHDDKTEKYFGDYWSQTVDVLFYYENYFYGINGSFGTINMKDTLRDANTYFYKEDPLTTVRFSVFLGYSLNLPYNFSIVPYAALQVSDFSFPKTSYENNASGYGLGLFINKYINLQSRRYLVIYINSSFNHINYNEFESSLGDYYYSINFGIGYKASFLQRMKE